MSLNKKVKCPVCNKAFEFKKSADRPFCSEKCKMIDLGNWFSETYTVPAVELDDEEIRELENTLDGQNEI